MTMAGKIQQLISLGVMLLLSVAFENGLAQQYREKEDDKSNYGNTPDEIFPYSRFQEPYKRHFVYPTQKYLGPAREKPEPIGLTEVRIGFLGPLHGSNLVDFGSQMLQGAQMAMEEANAKGGFRGLPYKMMLHNDVGLWGAAANEIVKMDDEKVWAVLGTIDDNNTHIALRVVLKLEIPMVNTGDPDPTLTETNIPWLVRNISDDRQSSYALCTYMYQVKNYRRVSILRTNSRYGRVGTGEIKATSDRMGRPVILELRYSDGETDFTNQLQVIKKSSSDAVVLWGNPKELGMIVKQMRDMNINLPILGCDRIINPEFIEYAGKENAEGVVVTSPYLPDMQYPAYASFYKNYKKRFNMEPDAFAVHAYDGMNMIIKSIETAGLNRAKIRDVLLDSGIFQGYKGASGQMYFDASWNDIGEIYMTEIKNGEFKYFKRPEYKSGEASIGGGSQNIK
jgi:ABC-type branched-subunit amino acid transport system substrate-binding protein